MVNESALTIGVVGAGYVGCVSAGCLSNDGMRVIAVDVDEFKVDRLNSGLAPIFEPGLDALIQSAREFDMLTATTDLAAAVLKSDVMMICVGTPSRDDGSLDTRYVEQVAQQVGAALRESSKFRVIVLRSTVLPGTMDSIVIPALESFSGKRAGEDFGVAYYPEFLRESTAIDDYYSPGAIVFGQYKDDTRSIDILKRICLSLPVEPHVIPAKSAEIVKYVNNCWHAVKTSFANEIGNLCKANGIDSHQVMDVVCADTRLNISKAYMRPGFAYGGSCLPKDLRALSHLGVSSQVPTPMLDAAREANQIQLDRALGMVRNTGKRRIGIVGLTFKANTDDLRESPMLALTEALIEEGFEVSVYDPNVSSRNDGGRNYMPHIAGLLCEEAKDVVARADVVVIGNKYDGVAAVLSSIEADLDIIDLVRMPLSAVGDNVNYQGLCW